MVIGWHNSVRVCWSAFNFDRYQFSKPGKVHCALQILSYPLSQSCINQHLTSCRNIFKGRGDRGLCFKTAPCGPIQTRMSLSNPSRVTYDIFKP
jgi:hypothetical protein